jgi:uncharacterized protein
MGPDYLSNNPRAGPLRACSQRYGEFQRLAGVSMQIRIQSILLVAFSISLANPSWADFKTAVAAQSRGDYATAFREFKPLAENGDARSQYNLAQMYASGKGVPQNFIAASSWFHKAAEQGDTGAQSFLGQMYFSGHGVDQNYSTAAHWWRKAAEQGDLAAAYNLGSLYLNGQGVMQSFPDALNWNRKAALKGFAMAQNNLGFMYANGYGVPQDYIKAYAWGSLAAAQGVDLARKLVVDLTARMNSAQIAEAKRLVNNLRSGSGS